MHMKDKTKKIIAIIVVVLFLFVGVLPLASMFVNAAPSQSQLEKQLKDSKDKKADVKEQINEVKEQKKDVLAEKQVADTQVKELEQSVDQLSDDIAKDDGNIINMQADLDVASIAAKKQYDTFKKRVRIMYEQGPNGYLEALLQSESITDFLNRFEIVKVIAAYDKDMTNKLEQTQKEIADKKANLEEVRNAKAVKMSSMTNKKVALNSKQQERDSLIKKLDQTASELEKIEKKIEAEEARTRAEIARLSSPSTKYAGGKMEWPAPGYYTITSSYGPRFHPVLKVNKLHTGVDIGAPSGAKVVAANDGKVIKAGYNNAYGNHVIVDHGGGIATLYAHASSLSVSVGQTVTRGQKIMSVGSTGYSTGAHLHFEVIINGSTTNPMGYFK